MDFTHSLTVVIIQAVLTLTGGCALAWFGWKLNRRAKEIAPVITTPLPLVVPDPVDPDLGPRLLWKDARITELEHQIDRERLEHTEELASRNRLIANLRDELVLSRRRHPEGSYTPTQRERTAESRTNESQRIVDADDGAGIGDGGLIHGERDGKNEEGS